MMKGGKEGISWPTRGSADDYATTTPPAPTKLHFRLNNLSNVVRNVHDCARAVRLIDQAHECAADF